MGGAAGLRVQPDSLEPAAASDGVGHRKGVKTAGSEVIREWGRLGLRGGRLIWVF